MSFEIERVETPDPRDVDLLEERLYEFNQERTGYRDGRWLTFFVRDDAGEIVAGLHGHTWGGSAEVRFLWVEESRRRGGLGASLLRAAEDEARHRGARQVVLDTHDFQAPEFYRRLGYERLCEIEDSPVGHRKIYFRKRLA